MAWSQVYQRAILAARDVLAAGGRVLASSRSFWAKYDFPFINVRRDIVQAARELLSVGNRIEAGGITGSLADAMSDAGIPTSDLSGGITGASEATIFVRVKFTDPAALARNPDYQPDYRTIKTTLPWWSSLAQLDEAVSSLIDDMLRDSPVAGELREIDKIVLY